MKIILTGCAGFIGYHVARRLLAAGHRVYGIDDLNPYYDPQLKLARLHDLFRLRLPGILVFNQRSIANTFEPCHFDCNCLPIERIQSLRDTEVVIHLAAQAGVQYSTVNPDAYMAANVMATYRMLEVGKILGIKHFIYASSSSVYGDNPDLPWREESQRMPANLYGTTKAITEELAQAYEPHFPTTGLRFFTVYGPWGRPDMAFYKIARALRDTGRCRLTEHAVRDFTPVETVARLIETVLKHPAGILNVATGHPIALTDVAKLIAAELDVPFAAEVTPRESWDLECTWAHTARFRCLYGDQPVTRIDAGIKEYITWFKEYYDGK